MKFTAVVREVWRRELLEAAGHFFAKRLRIDSAPVHVVLTPAPQLATEFGAAGMITRVRKHGFIVAIGPADITSQLLVTAHELVHARQLISGKLVHRRLARGSRFIWRGEDLSHLAYHRRPWELEAMSKETVLMHQFVGELSEQQVALEARLAELRSTKRKR